MTRAAAAALMLVVGHAALCAAQQPEPPIFGIADNSFLIEEAFNQDPGVVQNIFMLTRSRHGGASTGSFTQEWPVKTKQHQLSVTLPFTAGSGESGLGDALINYRYQLADEGPGRPACAPRFSLIAPSSRASDGWGWQTNVPVSKRFGAVYVHGNLGVTRFQSATSPFAGGSAIWAARPMVQLMLELLSQSDPAGAGRRETTTTVVPGFRTGWNFGASQFVIGAGVPITRGATRDTSILGYVSYELPFKK